MRARLPPPPGAAVAATALLLWLWAAPASAQFDCQPENLPNFEFGDVGPAGSTTSITASFTCYNRQDTLQSATACMYFDPQNATDGVDPRVMVSWGATTERLNFDLYGDPSHSELVGSTSSGHPSVLVQEMTVPAQGRQTFHLPVYGLVPRGQAVLEGRLYANQMDARLYTAFRPGQDPPGSTACSACISSHDGNCDRQYRHLQATAQGVSGCLVTTATDLDFGQVDTLGGDLDGVSQISFECPVGTAWRVGLDAGRHADGETRRMSGPGGALIEYELYRDSARSQRWGNTPDVDVGTGTGTGVSQSLSVYGRVPAQRVPAAGDYSDTIRITLTF